MGVPVAAGATHLLLGPEADNPRDMLKPLLFGLLRLADRLWVCGTAVILVQAICDEVQVLLSECLVPLVDEFDLWGIRTFEDGHWDEAIGGNLVWGSGGELNLHTFISTGTPPATGSRGAAQPLSDNS